MGAFVYNRRDGMAERYTSNGGYYVTGTALNDTIVNGGYYDSYDYYSLQADHYHRGDNVNINGWEGSDEILNYGDKVYINGGSGDDSIENHWGRNVTICGGKGDDTVICQGEGSELIEYAPGDGNDVIYNFFDDEGRGTPDIDYYGECIYIGTGDMNDTSKVDDSYFDGSDFILKIGNGSITLKDAKGKRFEIQDNYNNGGRGTYTKVKVLKDSSDTAPSSDDTLPHDDNVIYGTPNDDTLENSRNNVRIEALSGNDTITNKGKSVAINGGSDDDSILNELDSDSSTIDGGAGSDRIDNRSLNVTIIGGAGDDFIINNGATVSIDAGDGNDYVTNRRGSSTINGGDGNDEISNSGNVVLVNGGTGDDTIANSAQRNVTIIGGKGDDSITNGILNEDGTQHDSYGRNVLFSYNTGDGSDTINGFNANSTLSISGGSYSSMTSGDDVIIKVGDGSITLKDAKDTSINVIGTYTSDSTPSDNPPDDNGEDTPDDDGTTSTTYKTQQDVIKAFMHSLGETSLSGTAALDEAVKYASGGKFKTYKKLIENFVTDCRNATSVDKFLKEKCNINLSNSDTGAITGWDAGGIAVKTAESIVEENGSLQPYNDSLKSFTLPHEKSGLSLIWSEPDNATDAQRKIVQGLYSWWFKGALDLVTESYGMTFKSTNINEVKLDFDDVKNSQYIKKNFAPDAPDSWIAMTHSYPEEPDDGITRSLSLWINMNFFKSFNPSKDVNGIVKARDSKQLLDSTLAHEFTHAIMSANINSYNDSNHTKKMPSLIKEGTAELTEGGDYRGIDQLLKNFRSRTQTNVVNSLLNDEEDSYAAGYTLLRYFAKQASSKELNGVHIDSDKTTIVLDENFTNSVLGVNDYFSSVKTIDASRVSQKMTLTGNSAANSLTASKGGSEMVGDRGDDTLHGGNGSDTFVYASGDGNDVFTDISSNDKIKITSGTIDSFSISGHDVVLKIGAGSITLKNAKGKKLTFIDSSGTETTKTYDNETQADPSDTSLELNPVISSTISRISARETENIVTDLDSLDDLTANGTSILTFTENSGSGIQNVNLRSSEYPQAVSLEGGNQKIQFNDANGNVAIVGASATGSKEILFGSGDDLGIFLSPKADIKTTVGSGNDSIITDNNARVRADMTEADNAQIIPYSGRVILDNYDHESQAEIVLPEVTDITSAVKDNSIQLVGNEIRFDSSTVKIKNSATCSTLVNLATENGDSQKVGFTGLNGDSLDTSKLDGDFLLKGNYGENHSNRGSKITAGKGNDTILTGSGDSVNGGDGANQIYLTPKELRPNEGASVLFTDKGTNTVHGFNAGFNDTSDTLLFDANDAVDLKFDGTNLSLKTDNGAQGVLTDLADDVSFVTLFVADEDKRDKLAVAKKDATITVDDNNFARMYYGDNSGVDFSNTTKDLFVELDNDETLLFDGITQVTAGSGQNTLIGSDNAEILISGNGYNSIYGGGGNDSLVGKGGSADKDGRTTFFFFAGDGRDVISNFEFLTPQNRYEGIDDKIDVGDSDVNNAYISGDNLVIEFDQDSYLVLENASGKDFRINNLIAKVDKNIAYDGNANCYVADGGTSLKVESTVSSAEIWLDNSHDTLFLGTPIRTLDASEVKGNTSLVGNEYDNTIIAGQGDASLWGGDSASDDVLIGGNSRNTFFYCNGNGHDVIQGINDGDSVILADVSLEQITDTEITAKSVSINFIDGGSLRIEGNADVTYQLADGSKYSANHEQLEWIDK